MKYNRFILSSFFLLFIAIYSPPTHAKIGGGEHDESRRACGH